jgi:hypothetical protein
MSWMAHVFAIALIVVGISSLAPADDYESAVDGDQIIPVGSDHIRMARERVECHVEWPSGFSDHSMVRVTAEFVLVNDSDRAIETLVAFPVGGENDFTRWIDDEPTPVELRPTSDVGWRWAWISPITFERGQARTVRVRYTARSDATAPTTTATWRYILTTGARWKGKIDEIRVVLHFPMNMPPGGLGPFRAESMQLSPAGFVVDGQTVKWVFRDIEPEEDIRVGWDTARALEASDPLKWASKEEAPGLQFKLACAYRGEQRARQMLALLKAFPDAPEVQQAEFRVAQGYTHRHISGGAIQTSGDDPRAAAAWYTESLKRPRLPAEMRTEALRELYLINCLDLNDAAAAARALEALCAQRLAFDRHRETVELIGLASAADGVQLLRSMTVSSDWQLTAHRLAEQLQRAASAARQ